jgi:integrase
MRVQNMLTDAKIKALTHSGKKTPDRHLDRDQLYLYVLPTGTKSWRLRYRHNGKEDVLVIGQYPRVSLKDARLEGAKARALIAQGTDPKKQQKRVREEALAQETNLFGPLALKWLSIKDNELAQSTIRKHRSRLQKYLLPQLGHVPITELTRRQILSVGEKIQATGALHEAHRVLRLCKQILEYATWNDLLNYNIAYGLTKGLAAAKTTHRAAPLNDDEIRSVLLSIKQHNGSPQVHACLQLVPHLFMSPIDIAHGQWADVDLEARTWSFSRRKSGVPTITPLTDHVVFHLRQMRTLYPESEWVFPSPNDISKPISSGSLNAALRRSGVAKNEATIHGFRATARTLLVEKFGYRQDIVEQQISHTVKDPNGRAYNRTMFLTERREMLETWSAYLRELISPTQLTSVA